MNSFNDLVLVVVVLSSLLLLIKVQTTPWQHDESQQHLNKPRTKKCRSAYKSWGNGVRLSCCTVNHGVSIRCTSYCSIALQCRPSISHYRCCRLRQRKRKIKYISQHWHKYKLCDALILLVGAGRAPAYKKSNSPKGFHRRTELTWYENKKN